MNLWCIYSAFCVSFGVWSTLISVNILLNIFFCVSLKKESHTGLEGHDDEWMNYSFSLRLLLICTDCQFLTCVCVCFGFGCWLTRIFSLNFSPVILQLISWYFCETEVCVCVCVGFTFACIKSSMTSLQTLSFLASLFMTLSVKCCLDFSKCLSHAFNQVLWYGK